MFQYLYLLFGINTTHAMTWADAITTVSGTLPGISGTGPAAIDNLGTQALGIASDFRGLIFLVAIIVIAVSGAEMAISQSDDSSTKARRTFLGSIVGLMLLLASDVLRQILFESEGANVLLQPETRGYQISAQMAGAVNFIAQILVVLAVLMIIISGIRAILEFGSGEGLGHLRRTIFGVIFGVLVVTLRNVILTIFYYNESNSTFGGDSSSANILITTLVDLFQRVLTFLGTVAVAIIIYAGLMMIVNFGNEEQFRKSRDLIVRVAIGFIIILASKAIIGAVFTGLTT